MKNSIKEFTDYISLEKKYSLNTVKAYQKDLFSFEKFCKIEFNIKCELKVTVQNVINLNLMIHENYQMETQVDFLNATTSNEPVDLTSAVAQFDIDRKVRRCPISRARPFFSSSSCNFRMVPVV